MGWEAFDVLTCLQGSADGQDAWKDPPVINHPYVPLVPLFYPSLPCSLLGPCGSGLHHRIPMPYGSHLGLASREHLQKIRKEGRWGQGIYAPGSLLEVLPVAGCIPPTTFFQMANSLMTPRLTLFKFQQPSPSLNPSGLEAVTTQQLLVTDYCAILCSSPVPTL